MIVEEFGWVVYFGEKVVDVIGGEDCCYVVDVGVD